jgi:hypothetical protein
VWKNLIFVGVLTVMKQGRDYGCRWSHVESRGVAAELMVKVSSPGTQMFVHDDFKMTKDIFAKVEFVEICVEYVSE